MAKELVKIFNPESFGGGGTFFTDGLYRIDEARFVKFDFRGSAPGKDGNGIVCLCCKLQPLDKDGGDVGEVVVQYWGVGDDASIESTGHSISLTGDRSTIWTLSDYGVFVEHLGKAKFDLDAMAEENDIGVLDGMVAEFGKVPDPKTGRDNKDADNDNKKKRKYPKQIPVVTSIPGGKKTGGKAAASKPAGKKQESGDDAVEEMLQKYLVEKVLVSKNTDGIDKLQARMGLNKFIQANGGDQELQQAVGKMFGDAAKLKAILESVGWELSGSTIKASA